MTRQAVNTVDKILSDDWRQVLVAVAGETVADQIWAGNDNPQPDNLCRSLKARLDPQGREALEQGWRALYLKPGTRGRCLGNWLEIMRATVGQTEMPPA